MEFCEKISELVVKLIDYAPVDAAVDEVMCALVCLGDML